MTTYIEATDTVPVEISPGLGSDVTQALLDWIATIPDGSGPMSDVNGNKILDANGQQIRSKRRLVIPAMYQTDSQFRLIGRADLYFDFVGGGGLTRVVDNPGIPVWWMTHCSNIEMSTPLLVGSKPSAGTYSSAHDGEAGIRFESCHYCYVYGAQVQHSWGDHFYFGKHSGDPVPTDHCEVWDANCGTSGRDSVAFTAANNCAVRRCSFLHGRTCIDLEPNGALGIIQDITIEDCTFTGPFQLYFAAANSSSTSTEGIVERITLQRNHVMNGNIQVMVGGGERRADWTVVDNHGSQSIGNPRQSIMQFNHVQGILDVERNTNPYNPNRSMRMARWDDFTQQNATITYQDNTPDQA